MEINSLNKNLHWVYLLVFAKVLVQHMYNGFSLRSFPSHRFPALPGMSCGSWYMDFFLGHQATLQDDLYYPEFYKQATRPWSLRNCTLDKSKVRTHAVFFQTHITSYAVFVRFCCAVLSAVIEDKCFFFFFGGATVVFRPYVSVSLLSSHSRWGFGGHYCVLGMECWSPVCKASTLPDEQSLQPSFLCSCSWQCWGLEGVVWWRQLGVLSVGDLLSTIGWSPATCFCLRSSLSCMILQDN